MFILDTCSWLKIQLIHQELKIDLRDILQKCAILLTHQLNDEINYYLKDFIDTTFFPILPVNRTLLEKFTDLEFDEADLSIIVLAQEKDILVITEDGALLMFLINLGQKSIQISEFFLTLLKFNRIDKRICYNLLKFLRERKNIKAKKYKKLRAQLQKFR
ncbi:MAG: hypothetical protein ACTSRS_16525 [Candidatus Helarchaeota archaeon]